MLKNQKTIRFLVLLLLGILMGVLFSSQSRSVAETQKAVDRENRVNIFKKIEILKNSNQDLRDQLDELKTELASNINKETAVANLNKEIEKYSIIAGRSGVEGEGLIISVDKKLDALWFTDLVNELFTAGAEAISINGIRVTEQQIGFDNIPSGQVLIGGEILDPPYEILAVGEGRVLYEATTQQGGIVTRLNKFLPEHQIKVERSDQVIISAAD